MTTLTILGFAHQNRPFLPSRRWLAVTFGVVALSLVIGFETQRHSKAAYVLALCPLLLMVLRAPVLMAIGAVGLIAFPRELAAGISPADALILAVALALAPQVVTGSLSLRPMRPMAWPLFAYSVAILFVLVGHPTLLGVEGAAQRVELFLLSMLLGALAVPANKRVIVMGAFVLGATLVAMVYVLSVGTLENTFGLDKNPAAGFMTTGLLILLSQEQLRKLAYGCAPILAAGIIAAQSRGAILGLLAGLAVLILLQKRRRLVLVSQIVGLAVVFLVGYSALPSEDQARVTTVSATGNFAISIRAVYRSDAVTLAREKPLTGVGLNDYAAATARFGTSQVDDPHSVFYEEAAEGGIPLLVAFVIVLAGSVLVILRHGATSSTATALAVQAAIIVHACVDVYWVRATPTMGWVLIGIVLAEKNAARLRAVGTAPTSSNQQIFV